MEFSEAFDEIYFKEAVELCYSRLDVMLLAISIVEPVSRHTAEVLLNPQGIFVD